MDKFKENVDYLKKGFVSMNIMLIQNMKRINDLNQSMLVQNDAVDYLKDTSGIGIGIDIKDDVDLLNSKMDKMTIDLFKMRRAIKNLERKTSTSLFDHSSCYS